MLLEIPAKMDDEPQYLVIGLTDGKHWWQSLPTEVPMSD